MRELNILIIDDVPFHREFEEEILLTLSKELNVNFNLDSASNINEAKEKIANKSYDLIVTDLKLPDGLGSELVPLIRDKDSKIIALTIYPNTYNEESSKFDLFLHKPITAESYKKSLIELFDL